MPRPARTYTLSHAILAANLGTGIMCLAAAGEGRAYRLHEERPGASLNRRAVRCEGGRVEWKRAATLTPSADLPSGAAHVVKPVEASPAPLVRVDISGPLEQRAGYHDPCDGWSDAHDAIAERLAAAFAEGDVLLVVDSPGGAAAGLQQNVERALAAKERHGRRVTVFADEMIGSAAMWWACAVGDELFVPVAGQTGSIGARGQHTSIKGALDKEGVLVTYFADPPEKVCFAPERLPDEETMRRGMRDVQIAADAFRAAIVASPLGKRHGLTPEYLIGLGADMLTGQEAVDAGLADGVESFDAVVAYALTLAESEPGSEARATKTTGASRAEKRNTMGLRASTAAPPGARAEAEDEKKEEEKGTEPTGKCGHCGMQNEDDAKFCDQCGKSMAAKKAEDDDKDDEHPPSSKSPPSSERKSEEKAGAHPPPPERMAAPAAMSKDAPLAFILGAEGTSDLAIRTAAIKMRQRSDLLSALTGKSDHDDIIGAALAIPAKIARGQQAAADLERRNAAAEEDERWALARRLNKTGAVKRTSIFADVVDDKGGRVINDAGRPLVRIRSTYANMPIRQLRSLVTDLEKDAPPKRRDPFQPDKAAAEATAALSKGSEPFAPSDAQIKALEGHPTVQALINRGSAQSANQLARGLAAADPKSARAFLAQNGVSP